MMKSFINYSNYITFKRNKSSKKNREEINIEYKSKRKVIFCREKKVDDFLATIVSNLRVENF